MILCLFSFFFFLFFVFLIDWTVWSLHEPAQNNFANVGHLGLDVRLAVVLKVLDNVLHNRLAYSGISLGKQLGHGRRAVARRGHERQEPRIRVDEHVAQRGKRLEKVGVKRQRRRQQVRVLLAGQQIRLGRGKVHDGRPVAARARRGQTAAASAPVAMFLRQRHVGRRGGPPRLAPRPAKHVRQAGAGQGRGRVAVELLERVKLGKEAVEAAEELDGRGRVQVVDGGDRDAEEEDVGGFAGELAVVVRGHAAEVRLFKQICVEPVHTTFVAVYS